MKHLLGIDDLGADGIGEVLRLADSFLEVTRRDIPKVPALRGKTVVSMFYEDSTRTRLSFETAAKRLSADTMTFSAGSSSLRKGESLLDTVRTVEAMGIDAIVVRHKSSGVPQRIAGWIDASIINAGDGWHEHPTQALLDAFTLRRHRGDSFAGMKVAIVGDIKHSRVARSNVKALSALGAEVTLVAPPTLLPPDFEGWPVKVSYDLDEVLPHVDVLYVLRIQLERQAEALFPSLREYAARYGITTERLARLPADSLVMHPGPTNRGVEIDALVADDPRSVINEQVANGVAVRMAVLYMLLGSGEGEGGMSGARSVVIKGGTVVDAGGARLADVLVEDGIIKEVAESVLSPAGATVLAADGSIVSPGFVDLHTHLREPGGEDAETIETGARAGALGGYTALVAMPNTNPPIDTAAVVEQVLRLGHVAPCHVVSSACITKGRAGEELAPLGELHGLGVRIFTDDGTCVADAGLMRRALEYARALPGAVLAQHCEDPALARGGHMNEGAWSSWLGIPGMPAEAESVVVARDIALAGLTGGRVHFLHLSTAMSIELVRAAKAKGLAVTAEAAPHHFTLTDSLCCGYDPLFKVNPPLRTDGDVKAVKEGLADGTIDAIATDHAPHPAQEKERAFDEAPPGMLGLETALALTLTELVGPGLLDLHRALALLSWQPARLAGLADHGGPIAPGLPAHLCVFDPEAVWEVDPTRLASRSRNTPYAGRKLTGRVRHTILAGEPVVIDSQAQR